MNRRVWPALLFGLVVIAALTLLRASDPYAVRVARETTFDVFQQIEPRQAPDDLPIRIIDIDEASLAELGQWPWPRSMLATLTERLSAMGAAAIGFDVLFSEPDRLSPDNFLANGEDYDVRFAKALAGGPTVLSLARNSAAGAVTVTPKAGMAITGAATMPAIPELGGAAQPLSVLAEAASGLGIANLDREGAGVARRLPLVWRDGETVFPALSAEALRLAMGVSTLVLIGDTADAGTLESLRVGDLAIPTGPTGDIWLYYRRLPQDLFVPARSVLSDDFLGLAPLVEGHIVLIGSSASGLLDIRFSPLGEAVSGVSIHAQALEQMLTGTYLNRADWVAGLEMVIFALAGATIILAVVIAGPMTGLLVSILAMAAIVAISWGAFAGAGLLIDPSYALFGALIVYAAMAFFRFAVTDADRRRIRRAFGHYIEPSLLSRIEADASLLRLGGDMRELTVMFSDVRSYSALAERTAPAELVAILNRLFAVLGAAIIRQMGTIDKFMGDAVMAFWNAPAEVDRHALKACRAALDMRQSLAALNSREADRLDIGIGIATGPALVGNMGFEQRFDYSCIGDTVNVASRIEGACKWVGHDILVSETTAAAAPELALLFAGWLELKGMQDREPVFALVGDEATRTSPAFIELEQAHVTYIAALGAGEADPNLAAACGRLVAAVDPGLARFYESIPPRQSDFVNPPLPRMDATMQLESNALRR